jgi:hypothetical protein
MANGINASHFSTGTVHPQHAYRGRSPMYWWILTATLARSPPHQRHVVEPRRRGRLRHRTGPSLVTDPSYFPTANGVSIADSPSTSAR